MTCVLGRVCMSETALDVILVSQLNCQASHRDRCVSGDDDNERGVLMC